MLEESCPAPQSDEEIVKFQYYPGVFLKPRVQEIPVYEKAVFRVSSWSCWVSMGAILFLLGMTFLDVLLRALFKMPFSGTYDWTRYLMIMIATFGMPLCTMNEDHVCVDFLVNKMPTRVQQGLTWLGYCIAVFVMYLYISQNLVQAQFNFITMQTSVGVPWPNFPFYYFIAFGFACMLSVIGVKMANLGRKVM